MHELSLCEAIADSVARHADGRPVRRASVRIGYLRQVVPESMSFCWQVLTDGTDLSGCELDIEHVPAVVACGAVRRGDHPRHAGVALWLVWQQRSRAPSGEELLLVSIDLAGVP